MIVIKKTTPLQQFLEGIRLGANPFISFLLPYAINYFTNKSVEDKILNQELPDDIKNSLNDLLTKEGLNIKINSIQDLEMLKDIDNKTATKIYNTYKKTMRNVKDYSTSNFLRKATLISNPDIVSGLDLNQQINKLISDVNTEKVLNSVLEGLPQDYKDILLTTDQRVKQALMLKLLLQNPIQAVVGNAR